jgi:Bor protein
MLRSSAVLLLFAVMGCYHATVETGAAPSEQVVERCCEAGFLGGLIPPKAVQSEAACPNGVARVETSRSFSNVVFTVLTAGLYSPMSVRITCASAPTVAGAQASMAPTATVHADSSGRAVP